jgi:hypothetical protein
MSNVFQLPQELGARYLEKRGITKELRDKWKIEIGGKTRAHQVLGFEPHSPTPDTAFLILPHYGFDKQPTEYAATRIVSSAKLKSKLLVPPSKLPRLHFPLHNPPLDSVATIYITESRLKADRIAEEGFYAIGMNGCWGFSAKKHGFKLLPDFNVLAVFTKRVVIVLDSNVETSEHVKSAEALLASNLHDIGLATEALRLPQSPEGDDWGIDDFYAVHGSEATRAFLTSPTRVPEQTKLQTLLHEMNEEVVYCRSTQRVIEIDSGYDMPPTTFMGSQYSHWTIQSTTSDKKVSVPRAWIAWPDRREVQEVVYEPGHPRITPGFFNLWEGMGVAPAPGDVSMFLEFMENNFPDPVVREWLLNWWAFPLQNLGAKLPTAVVLCSGQGYGKGSISQIMGHIYGQANFISLPGDTLESKFTDAFACRQYVVFEEMRRARNRDKSSSAYTNLKSYVTDKTIKNEGKGTKIGTVANHINFQINTNNLDALALDPDDRRFTIITMDPQVSHCNDAQYWNQFYKEIVNERGAAAIYHFLLERDLTQFDAYAHALETDAKDMMRQATLTVEKQLARDLRNRDTRADTLEAIGYPRDALYIESKPALTRYFMREGMMLEPTRGQLIAFTNAMKLAGADVFKIAMWVGPDKNDTARPICLERLDTHDTEKAKNDLRAGRAKGTDQAKF